jgi:hypothetical protein
VCVEAVVLGGVVVRGLVAMLISRRAEKHKFGFGLVPEPALWPMAV